MSERKIYAFFTSPKNPLKLGAQIIKLWQGSKYSHIAGGFPPRTIRNWLIFEAARGSVRYSAGQYWFPEVKIHQAYEISVSREVYVECLNVACKYQGAPYSMLENLGIVLAAILGKKKNPFGKGFAGFKCSEYYYIVLKELGYSIPEGQDPDLLDVKDIHAILEEMSRNNDYQVKEVTDAIEKILDA